MYRGGQVPGNAIALIDTVDNINEGFARQIRFARKIKKLSEYQPNKVIFIKYVRAKATTSSAMKVSTSGTGKALRQLHIL